MPLYPSYAIFSATLQHDKAKIEILPEYPDYAGIFSIDLAIKILENTGINKYIIELVESK